MRTLGNKEYQVAFVGQTPYTGEVYHGEVDFTEEGHHESISAVKALRFMLKDGDNKHRDIVVAFGDQAYKDICQTIFGTDFDKWDDEIGEFLPGKTTMSDRDLELLQFQIWHASNEDDGYQLVDYSVTPDIGIHRDGKYWST